MGKKENLIKKLNAEYYKEQNKSEEIDESKYEEDKILSKQEEKLQKEEEKFEKTVEEVIKTIKDYTSHQGLMMFDNHSVINIENYINYLIHDNCKSVYKPLKKEYKVETKTTDKVNNYVKISNEKETNLIRKGMKELENEYLEFSGNKKPDLHEKLIEQFGYSEYYDMVIKLGKI